MIDDTREMTKGEKFIGLNFNPSGDERVNKVKMLCAEIIDLLEQEVISREQAEVLERAKMLVLEAQMMCVKGITYKF